MDKVGVDVIREEKRVDVEYAYAAHLYTTPALVGKVLCMTGHSCVLV